MMSTFIKTMIIQEKRSDVKVQFQVMIYYSHILNL